MATFIIFFRFTEKGSAKIKESPARVREAKETARRLGGTVKQFFALTGSYDTMFILEAPGDDVAARIALSIGSLGNVQTEVVRAFDENEFAQLVAEL